MREETIIMEAPAPSNAGFQVYEDEAQSQYLDYGSDYDTDCSSTSGSGSSISSPSGSSSDDDESEPEVGPEWGVTSILKFDETADEYLILWDTGEKTWEPVDAIQKDIKPNICLDMLKESADFAECSDQENSSEETSYSSEETSSDKEDPTSILINFYDEEEPTMKVIQSPSPPSDWKKDGPNRKARLEALAEQRRNPPPYQRQTRNSKKTFD